MAESIFLSRPRHWSRYSLRTMLVAVTVFAIGLGWELKFVRERQAWRKEHRERVELILLPTREVSLPWWRKWLGDQAVPSIAECTESVEDRQRIKRLFPEAEFHWVSLPYFVPE